MVLLPSGGSGNEGIIVAKALTDARIRSIKSDTVRRDIPTHCRRVVLHRTASAINGTLIGSALSRPRQKSPKGHARRLPLMPLKAARDKATEVLKAVSEGKDPAREKQTKSAAKEHQTVEAAIEEFIRLYVANKRPKTIYERNRVLRREVIPPGGTASCSRSPSAMSSRCSTRSRCARPACAIRPSPISQVLQLGGGPRLAGQVAV